jgi:DNA-binding response OmpR family regulator
MMPGDQARRILVVDDDDAMRTSTARLLRRAGYEVTEAATGGEAVRVVSENRIDAIVLDICLPDVDGFQVCRDLGDRMRDLPVLCVSGNAVAVDDRVRALDAGARGFLTRPVASAELVATVGSMLRGAPLTVA